MLWATEMGTLRFVQPSMLSLAAGPSIALWEEQSLFLLSLQMSGVFPYTSVSPFMVCSFKNVCCKHLHSPTCSSTCHEKFGNVTRCFLSLVLIRLPSILKGNPLEPISGDCWSILPYLFLLEQHPHSLIWKAGVTVPCWTVSLVPAAASAHISAPHTLIEGMNEDQVYAPETQYISCMCPNFLAPFFMV